MALTSGYRVLIKEQAGLIKDVDTDCKNKWKFQWLEEQVHVVKGSIDKTVNVGDSIVKTNLSGKASCEWCHSVLSYKEKGLSTLKEHLKQKVMERVCKLKQQISSPAIIKLTAIGQAKKKKHEKTHGGDRFTQKV